MDDTVECLGFIFVEFLEFFQATSGPGVGAFEGKRGGWFIGVDVEALVEGEDEIGAKFFLDLHRCFRGDAVFGLIDMRCKGYAVIVDFAETIV